MEAAPAAAKPTEWEGVPLHLSTNPKSTTGYRCVKQDGYRFKVVVYKGGRKVHLAGFNSDSAVEAAFKFAKWLREQPPKEKASRKRKTAPPATPSPAAPAPPAPHAQDLLATWNSVRRSRRSPSCEGTRTR